MRKYLCILTVLFIFCSARAQKDSGEYFNKNKVPVVIKYSVYVELLGNSLNRPSLNYDIAFLKDKKMNFALRIGIWYWTKGPGVNRSIDSVFHSSCQCYEHIIKDASTFSLNIPLDFSYFIGLKNFFELSSGITYTYNSLSGTKNYFSSNFNYSATRNFLHSLIFIPRIGYRLQKPKGFFMRASLYFPIHIYEFKKAELGKQTEADFLIKDRLWANIPPFSISLGLTFNNK